LASLIWSSVPRTPRLSCCQTKPVAYAPRIVWFNGKGVILARSTELLPFHCLYGFIEPPYAGREGTENFERYRRISQDNLSEVLWAQGQ
jgi:hypothetical protein